MDFDDREDIAHSKIVEKVVNEAQSNIIELLVDYHLTRNNKKLDTLDLEEFNIKVASEIIDLFAKVINRIGRFADYKSKIKVLLRGDKISAKEKERCNFIIKIANNKSIKIVKNTLNDIDGTFVKKE